MPLNRGEVNPLGILGLRKLPFIPAHFKTIHVDHGYDVKMIEHWIMFNLKSRYAFKNRFIIDDKNKLIDVLEVGLEDPKEVTLLYLGCPYLHNKKEIW
jgi:hypothetical protein